MRESVNTQKMTHTLKYIGIILLFVIFGFLTRGNFYDISFSKLDLYQAQIQNQLITSQFLNHLLFSLFVGSIPLLYFIVKKIRNLSFMYHGLISYLIIVSCGILFWQLRILKLNIEFKKLSEFSYPNGVNPLIDLTNLRLESYLLLGFIVGTMLSIFIFKNKRAGNRNV